MKRWELQELKNSANRFVKEMCQMVYRYYYDMVLDGQYEYRKCIDGWNENKFTITVSENNGEVEVNFNGLSKVYYSERFNISHLIEMTPSSKSTWWYALKDLIMCLNEFGFSPDSIEISCTSQSK